MHGRHRRGTSLSPSRPPIGRRSRERWEGTLEAIRSLERETAPPGVCGIRRSRSRRSSHSRLRADFARAAVPRTGSGRVAAERARTVRAEDADVRLFDCGRLADSFGALIRGAEPIRAAMPCPAAAPGCRRVGQTLEFDLLHDRAPLAQLDPAGIAPARAPRASARGCVHCDGRTTSMSVHVGPSSTRERC